MNCNLSSPNTLDTCMGEWASANVQPCYNSLILLLKMRTVSYSRVLILGSLVHNSLACVMKYGGCFACGGYFGKMDVAMNWPLTSEFHQVKESL